MKQFTMSQFRSKEDLYKAKSIHMENRYQNAKEALDLIEGIITNTSCNISLTEYSNIKRILDESKCEEAWWR